MPSFCLLIIFVSLLGFEPKSPQLEIQCIFSWHVAPKFQAKKIGDLFGIEPRPRYNKIHLSLSFLQYGHDTFISIPKIYRSNSRWVQFEVDFWSSGVSKDKGKTSTGDRIDSLRNCKLGEINDFKHTNWFFKDFKHILEHTNSRLGTNVLGQNDLNLGTFLPSSVGQAWWFTNLKTRLYKIK